MPATRESVLQIFDRNVGRSVLREQRGNGRRIAKRITLLDPAGIAEHLVSSAYELDIDDNVVTAVGTDGFNTSFIFQG